jgi:hypothetical protein
MGLRVVPAMLSVVLAPFIASAQTDPALLRFVHPDAKALISIDWKRVRQSHLGTMIREKWIDGNPGGAIPGVEFLDDIDRFVISSPGRNPMFGSTEEAPMLVVVAGHFDLAKIRKLLDTHGAKPQMFNNVQVYRPQGKSGKEMAFVLLDAQTILIGDARSIFDRLEHSAFPLPPDSNSLLARAAQLDTNYDVWALMTTPGVLASDRLMDMFTGGELGTEAHGFEIGFSLRSGFTVDTTVMFQSETAAKRMASELSKLLKLTIKDKLGEPAMLDMEKKLKVTSEGVLVKIAMHMTQQELDQNAKIFAVSRKQPAAPVAEIRPLMIPGPPAPKPEKKVIRIEGLDEGTREIPYRQQ